MTVDLGDEWERCKPWIVSAIANGPLADSLETVEAKIKCGQYMLASSENAAALVEFCKYGEHEVSLVRFGGGSLDELLDVIQPRVAAHAKETGRMMMSEGRLGWLKPAKARGYKLAWITMVKE